VSKAILVAPAYPSSGEVMIKVEHLTKKFGDFTAVDDISFEVEKGEVFGFLGPNGAGKSTTLRVLSTLGRPSGGKASIGGYDIVKQDTEVRKLIGIVSEKMIMYDRLTARENLWFFGKLFNIPTELLVKRIDELLDLVQLTKFRDVQVGTFSTGMRQRLNVVRALLNMPQVLFLDEPTLGLDPQSTVEIRDFVKKLNRENGTTVIVTTHSMVDADMMCDRIGIIDHGKLVALDTSANLKKLISGDNGTALELDVQNLTQTIVEQLRALPCVETLSQSDSNHLKLLVKGEDSFDSVIDAVRQRGGKIESIESQPPTLEDVFLHLTGHEVRDSADQKMPVERRGRWGGRGAVRQRVR